MQKVIEGWVPEGVKFEEAVAKIPETIARAVYSTEGICHCCYGSAKKVRVTILVEEIDRESKDAGGD